MKKSIPKELLSHYSKRTVDLVYDFPFGTSELYGLAYRTDFDLSRHAEFSGESIEYTDPETREKFIPHVIEPTFGVERTILALLCAAYDEEKLENGEMRTVLHFAPRIAPVKAAVFPLMNKEPLADKALCCLRSSQARAGIANMTTEARSAAAIAARTSWARPSASPSISILSKTIPSLSAIAIP